LAVAFRETAPEWTDAAKKKREETGESTPPRVIDDLYYRLDGDGYFDERRFHLYVVDVSDGSHRLLFDRDTTGWFSYDWSPDSKELVVSANTSRDAVLKPWKVDLYRVDVATGKSRKVPDLPIGEKSCVCWSPDGKWIAFSAREGKEIWGIHNTRLFVCSANGGRVRDLTEGTDYCLTAIAISDTAEAVFEPNIRWSPDSKRVYTSIGWHGAMRVASAAVVGGDLQFHTPDKKAVCMGNFSDDGTQLALTIGDQLTVPEVVVGRLAKKAARLKTLTQFNHEPLSGLSLAPAESHWIDSESGTKVHVWVMKPPGFREGKKYPAILEIHGGPHAQYGETFFHEFQVLASAGYVVVYSNPRGSKGYGEDHCAAIKGQWGQADWEDIQAVAEFMKQQPFIDTKRMGVMGGSYGGYMTNWAIGHCQDFAAAITDRCVSNLVSMVGSSDVPLIVGDYWDGNSWDKTEEIWEQSPLKHFGNVKTPTLVIHSEGDLRCNVEQGEQVFAALKLLGVPARFIRYPNSTSHGMSRCGPPDLRQHRLNEILRWWKEYLR
jgi:dipeptidyl aminopeptidase/acylaminoacyl peptidase